MPDPFNDDATIQALNDVYQHATRHGLTASGIEIYHQRYSDMERVEVSVHTGSYTYPRDFVDWITSFEERVPVRVERRDANHGNDLLLRARVEQTGFLWRIHWHTVFPHVEDQHGWFRGADEFQKRVAFIRAREDRQLLANEIKKLVAWGHTFEWHGKEAS